MIKIIEQPPNDALVDLLEDLLNKAKSGEVISIAVAMHTKGNCTTTAFELGRGDIAHLNLALDRIKLRLLDYVGEY